MMILSEARQGRNTLTAAKQDIVTFLVSRQDVLRQAIILIRKSFITV